MSSMKKTGYIVAGAAFILIMLILILRGCSVMDKEPVEGTMGRAVNNSVNDGKMVSEEAGYDVDDSVLNGSGNDSNIVDGKESAVGNTEACSESETISGDSENQSEYAESESGNLSLHEVDSVSIENKYSADVLVSAKKVYLMDSGVYAYALRLILPVEGRGYKLVDYMCSVSTWNTVVSGDSIRVEYGVDSDGNVIILSVGN